MNQSILDGLGKSISKEYPEKISNSRFVSGDSNTIIQNEIIPEIQKTKSYRGLVFLDPFGAHIDWDTIMKIASTKKLDLIIHFSIFDMHRNIGTKEVSELPPDRIERFNKFFGCEDWQNHTHEKVNLLFGEKKLEKLEGFEKNLVDFYKRRLFEVAEFKCVEHSTPIKHPTTNARFFYLFFVSHSERGGNLAKNVCKKFEE